MKLYAKISEIDPYYKLAIPRDNYERKKAVDIPEDMFRRWLEAREATHDSQDEIYRHLMALKAQIEVSAAG